jgi:hypothetical protein
MARWSSGPSKIRSPRITAGKSTWSRAASSLPSPTTLRITPSYWWLRDWASVVSSFSRLRPVCSIATRYPAVSAWVMIRAASWAK